MSEPINIDPDGNITFKINIKAFLKVFIILGLSYAAGYLPISGLTESSRICLMLFVCAAGLWITEAIPPFATAIMVIVMSVYILGNPGIGHELTDLDYRIFLSPVASPVLFLFFGGFILAAAATKHGLDIRLARAFIKPFGTHPRMVLLGIILTTGIFSMFMSNTATTAMMIAIMAPLFKRFEGRDPFKMALVLAIPFAANIGGIGTIIGTPPNAPEPLAVTWDLVTVVATFSLTVFLWLTEPLHGIPAAVTALIPVMVFTMFGIIDVKDLKQLDWDILILVAGGLTLGVAMKSSGLSDLLVVQLSAFSVSPFVLIIILILFSTMISNFMSNTSAANLIIPIATSLAAIDPKVGAFAVAFACSLAMSLPISTPPNAIAFATHAIETKDMAKYGTLISLLTGLIT